MSRSSSTLERVVEAKARTVALELPVGAVELLYEVLGHFPHDPGSWSNVARARCSVALMDARDVGERGREYRVVWKREGQASKRRLYQTLAGAEKCAETQETARDEMDWLSVPLPEIESGPVVESRTVGAWTPVDP